MNIYEFDNYKSFVNNWITEQSPGGRGEYRRMSIGLNVSSTMISQIFKGDKELSLELALELADYIGLDSKRKSYLLLLVEYSRAGSFKLKQCFGNQIKEIQANERKLDQILKKDLELNQLTKDEFYSNWAYSAVRLSTDIAGMDSVQSLAEKLGLPRALVQKVLDFLIKNYLVIEKNGQLKLGPARTHIEKGSKNVLNHHQNWRIQSLNRMTTQHDDDLFFTGPMVLSYESVTEISKLIPEFIKSISDKISDSKSETTRCLNIDWFHF